MFRVMASWRMRSKTALAIDPGREDPPAAEALTTRYSECRRSVVTTNKAFTPAALWALIAGRGAQEKTYGERQGRVRL